MPAEPQQPQSNDDAFKVWASGGGPSGNYLGRTGATIKLGPRVCKTASVSLYGDAETGEIRKRELRVSSYPRGGDGGFDFENPETSWFIENEEIPRLLAYLNDEAVEPGRYRVIDTASLAGELLGVLDDDQEAAHAVVQAIAGASDPALTASALAMSAGGLNAAELAVLTSRRALVDEASAVARERSSTETDMQRIVGGAWWLFGGRYVRVLERRDLLNLDQHDIPLIAADGSLHIVELKGPCIPGMVKRHRNHWIVGTDVHEATMQAANYIRTADELGMTLQTLISEELGLEINLRRVFATVVIGHRDHVTTEMPDGQFDLAIRSYNSTLSRIEVMSYDQLFSSAARMLQFESM